MCLNCGCMMPDNDMGDPDNITMETLRNAARAGGNRSIREAMANIAKAYASLVKDTPQDTETIR